MNTPTDPRSVHLAKSLHIEEHGTAEEQKNTLVAEIVCLFTDPDKWPMTDAQRIDVLKKWYRAAQNIRWLEAQP